MESAIQQRYDSVLTNLSKIENFVNFLQSSKTGLESEVKDLTYESDLYQKSSEIIKKWLEDSIKQNIESVADLVTTGLSHVIHDQDLKFKINQEIKYNKISMNFSLIDGDVEGDPLNMFGGGPASIISFILRIATMARLGNANLLILDESLSSLANYYVPEAANFMKKLSEETGINILMVTHNDEFIERSHIAYEGVKTKSFQLRKVSR